MAVFLRFLLPLLLFPLVRWGLPRALAWMARRYERQKAERRAEGPIIEGHLTRPKPDLRDVPDRNDSEIH